MRLRVKHARAQRALSWVVGTAVLGIFESACGPASGPEAVGPFVVFSQPAVFIGKLGVPLAAPVAVGSTLSQATVTSDDPTIVRITPDGALVGLRAGTTQIRARQGGSVLRVDVRLYGEISLEPGELELSAGQVATFRVAALGGDGVAAMPPDAQWFSDDARVALVRGGLVEAVGPGTAIVTLRFGDLVARAPVRVTSDERARDRFFDEGAR